MIQGGVVKEGRRSVDWKVEGDVTKGGLDTKGDGERSTGLCRTNNMHVTYGLYDYQKYY